MFSRDVIACPFLVQRLQYLSLRYLELECQQLLLQWLLRGGSPALPFLFERTDAKIGARAAHAKFGARRPTSRPPDAKNAVWRANWRLADANKAVLRVIGRVADAKNWRLPCPPEGSQLLQLPFAGPSKLRTWDNFSVPGPYSWGWSEPCGMRTRLGGEALPGWTSQLDRRLECTGWAGGSI